MSDLRDRIAEALTARFIAKHGSADDIVRMAHRDTADAAMAEVLPEIERLTQRADDAISAMKQGARREGGLISALSDVKVALGLPTLPLHPDLPDAARRLRERAEQAERERDVAVAAADPFKIERVASLVAASTRLVRIERDAERQNAQKAEAAVKRVRALLGPNDLIGGRRPAWVSAVQIRAALQDAETAGEAT